MQAVILAAGKSTRTYPITLTRPKPLLNVANKPLIEHTLDNLIGIASEAIIVVGYMKNQIKNHIGDKYRGIKIRYVEQKRQLGTGHALLIAEKYIKGKFIMLAGDDIYNKNDIKKCLKHDYCVLMSRSKNPGNFGVILEKNGVLVDFIEKPKEFISDKINTSLYCLDKDIFHYIKKCGKTERGEIELPSAIKLLSMEKKVHCVNAARWIPIGYPWDIIKADMILRKGKNKISRDSKVYGKIRNSSIGKKCTIYGNVTNSVIMDNSIIGKNSSVSGSIIGSNVVFNGRALSKKTSSIVRGKKITAGNFGCAVGDNCTLDNVVAMPGVKISPNKYLKNLTISNDL